MPKPSTWRVVLTFGRLELRTHETALSEIGAIAAAQRYAAALGYGGQPTRIESRRIA